MTNSTPTTTRSLVDLAQAKQLPQIQHMDAPTLTWIEDHRPDFGNTDPLPRLPPEVQTVLQAIILPEGWLANPSLRDSLHGQRHGLRAAVYAAYLGIDLSPADQLAAVVGALVHDCRRHDDQADEGHGQRSAQWFSDHADSVAGEIGIALTPAQADAVAAAICWHETPYSDLPANALSPLVHIVKTADALDRYRLPKLKWWINDDYLQLVPTASLKQFAFDLVVASERLFVQGTPSTKAVHIALQGAA
jgi:hypothetical protein